MKPSSLINQLGKDTSSDSNKILENIRKQGSNKSCFDCGEKGVTYVVPKFGTFVCSRCSGIHREIGNMVKGLGVSNFTDKEVAFLKEMGNDNAKSIWLAKFDSTKHKLPKANDENSIKEHLKLKYTNKKWYTSPNNIENDTIDNKGKNKNKVSKIDDESDDDDIKPNTIKKKPKVSTGNTNTNINIAIKNPIVKEMKSNTIDTKVENSGVSNMDQKLSKIVIGKNSQNINNDKIKRITFRWIK